MTWLANTIKRNKGITAVIVLAAASLVINLFAVRENRELLCSQADLIAHVPAAQFPDESLEDFIGWIEARRNVLEDSKGLSFLLGGCADRIISDLEDRVETDDQLVEELREAGQKNLPPPE